MKQINLSLTLKRNGIFFENFYFIVDFTTIKSEKKPSLPYDYILHCPNFIFWYRVIVF